LSHGPKLSSGQESCSNHHADEKPTQPQKIVRIEPKRIGASI
jgi:hypothetical protein